MELKVVVENIRNIKKATICVPLEKGLYAFVGENGCGKSTLMLIMSLIIKRSSAYSLAKGCIGPTSTIDLITDQGEDHWKFEKGKLTTGDYCCVDDRKHHGYGKQVVKVKNCLVGFYEGSVFYGSRFDDFLHVDSFLHNTSYSSYLIPADKFVSENLGYILHNNTEFYSQLLYKIKNRRVAEDFSFKRIPYFAKYGSRFVSQFHMSSGECLLISLLDFVNNLVIKAKDSEGKVLFLLDEAELALHPSAIVRLFEFLDRLVKSSSKELVIYFSTHSSELIQRISPRNIYLIENGSGEVSIVNPCYPNYAIRTLYIHDGFDFVLLVEDELAKSIVEKVIRANQLSKSKLCCVLPAGGWAQMLKLHHDMVTYNTFGTGKHIISIYDGDVEERVSKKDGYKTLKKCFLPIPSVEKYLKKKLIDCPDRKFIKLIGDKYFNQRSLQDIISGYKNKVRTLQKKDADGKKLYETIVDNIGGAGMSENDFIKHLSDDIYDYEKPLKFVETLTNFLSSE